MAPGDTLQVEIGARGRGGAGGSTFGTQPGGGGGGDGDCPGHGGANGGSAGGGGGGGSAGGSSSWGGKNTVGVRTSDGDAYVSLTFNRSPVAPKFTSASSLTVPAVAAVDDNIAFRAAATGFEAPKFSLSGAPAWMTIDADSGQITGAVPARTAGKFAFTIMADNGFAVTSQPFTLDVTAAPLSPQAPGTLTGYVRNPFSARLTAGGGVGAYHWSKTSGSLPAGLRLSSSGAITGTPTATGTATFTARVTDSALPTAASATESVKLTIARRTLTVTTKSLPGGTVGRAYSQPLAAAMGTGLNGPQGLAFDAAGNLLVANTYGNSLTEYKVSDSGDVAPQRTIAGPTTGLKFPHGVDVDERGDIYVANELGGTSTLFVPRGGLSKFSAAANGDARPLSTIASFLLSSPTGLAVAPPLSVHSAKLRAATVGHAYSAQLRAALGTTPYRWTRTGGRLPRGLHLGRDGRLSGRPQRRGTFRFTVRVRDASRPSMDDSRALVLVIRGR